MRSLREELVALVDQVPAGLHPLASVALGLFDRFELLDAIEVMHDAADWAEPEAWHERARAWADALHRELLGSIADAPAAS